MSDFGLPQTADVVFPGVDQVFSYRLTSPLWERAAPGKRVLAPFGKRRLTGTIVATRTEADPRATREVETILDEQPAFSAVMLKFTRWIGEYYLCPWGDVLKAALPAGISLDEKRYWNLSVEADDPRLLKLVGSQAGLSAAVEAMAEAPVSTERMKRDFGLARRAAPLQRLEEAGLIAYRPVLRAPRVRTQFDSVVLLSNDIREQYGAELFTRLRSVHEQHLIREVFESGPDGILKSELLKGASSGRRAAFARLTARGNLELRAEEVTRWDPQREVIPDLQEPDALTLEQRTAVAEIVQGLERRRFEPFLLFGVTGSGKTQVYIEAIRHALAQERTALVLLPEIALTPFVWGRFYRVLGDRVAIQHSAQSPAVRYDLWRDIRAGRYPVVVGARSAVFAPLDRLGLIVVDEEQEPSYKQEDPAPRYHARDAALVRARLENAVAVLGSATPSVESFQHASAGRYRMLRLPQRVGGAVMPEIHVVERVLPPFPESEPAKEKEKKKASRPRFRELPLFTDELLTRIETTLERSRQVVLLQNRRGFAPFLICPECGKIPECPNCSVSLTFHRRGVAMRCHYCDHREAAPDACPRCACPEWLTQGYGTQRIEEELATRFPSARILRMDSDSVTRRGTHGRMVAAFAAGEYDILVGTQMVAKGLDFPRVELAAVVQADAELFYPDFRSSERAAALLTQLAGRAGRRTEPGTVIVQSAVADHPVLQSVLKADWEEFVRNEIENRARSGYPPAARLILLRATGKDQTATVRALLRVRRLLQPVNILNVLGPAPALIPRVRGLYRHHLLVRSLREKDSTGARLRKEIVTALERYRGERPEPGVHIERDVDPQTVI
ncbi:primosomal protein N' [bacterium]|nr:primosomal protein N' [bacterium]MBU1984021.1 primosomal protein N' [bacterium]